MAGGCSSPPGSEWMGLCKVNRRKQGDEADVKLDGEAGREKAKNAREEAA